MSNIFAYSILIVGLMISSVQISHAQTQPFNKYESASISNLEKTDSKFDKSTDKKQVSTARRVSFFSTLLPSLTSIFLYGSFPGITDRVIGGYVISLAFTGAVIGPSMGSYYAEQSSKFRRGILIRTGALGLAAIGAGPMDGFAILEQPDPVGQLVMFSGIGLYALHSIYDIIRGSRRAVEAHNEAVSDQVSVAPWIAPEGDGGGLQLQVRF